MLGSLQVARRPLEAARHEPRVGVKEEQKVRLCARRALIAACREPAVLGIPDDLERRNAGEFIRRVVGRRIVDDGHGRESDVVAGNGLE